MNLTKHWNAFWEEYKIEGEAQTLPGEFPLDLIDKNSRIVELGCGSGRVVDYFNRLGYNTYGIDISENAVKVIKTNAKRQRLLNKVVINDCSTLAFKNESFGTVICLGVLEHYPREKEMNSCLSEIKRVLTNKGVAIVSLPHRISAFIFVELFKRLTGKWHVGLERKFFPKNFIKSINHAGLACIRHYYRPMDISPAKGIFYFPALILRWIDTLLAKTGLGGHMTTYILRKI